MKKKSKNELKRVIDEKVFSKFCHDLKNPLTILKLNLSLILEGEEGKSLTPKLKKMLSGMNKEVDRMTKMISTPLKNINTKEGGK